MIFSKSKVQRSVELKTQMYRIFKRKSNDHAITLCVSTPEWWMIGKAIYREKHDIAMFYIIE